MSDEINLTVPSIVFKVTLPVKPSVTTTSTVPLTMSSPSTGGINGEYNVVLLYQTNCTNAQAVGFWYRVGDMVTVFGRADLIVTATATSTSAAFPLPIAPNPVAGQSWDAGGSFNTYTFSPFQQSGAIANASGATNTATLEFISNGTGNLSGAFHFSYVVGYYTLI